MRHLAEEHRHQLRPAGEPFGSSFRVVFSHQRRELRARKMLQQLIEQARRLYHSSCPPWGISDAGRSPKDNPAPEQL
jgi:hypothetical protein